MTDVLAISLVLLLAACNGTRGEETRAPVPAPTPTEAKPAAPASCKLQVSIASNKIDFDGPTKGSVATAADLAGALAKVDRTCTVVLATSGTFSYREMITVLGELKVAGFSRLAVSDASKAWTLPFESTFAKMLVVTVSKVDVLVGGKSIGKTPGAPDLAAAVTAALDAINAKREAATLVIEADAETSAPTISEVIVGAHAAGCDEVLFDDRVRTK